jgi:hypothetical protein
MPTYRHIYEVSIGLCVVLRREIELEHWADEGEPTEEEVLHSAVIDEIKCFEIYPRLGALLPGQTLTLNLAYHYNSMVRPHEPYSAT